MTPAAVMTAPVENRSADKTAAHRILFVVSHFKELGGAEKNVLDLLAGLRASRDVALAVMQSGALVERARALGVPVFDLDVQRIVGWRALRQALSFRRMLRSHRYDLVVTYHHDADLWAGAVAASAGIPVVASRRDMGFQLRPTHVWAYRLARLWIRRVVSVSNAVKGEVARREGMPVSRIATVHNGVDLTGFDVSVDRTAVRRENGLTATGPIVGMVASFRPVKGQAHFVRAAAELHRRHPDAQFVVVGYTNTPYFRDVRALADRLGLGEAFLCLGDRADVRRLLAAFDVFALSSEQEGFSNALVEAMASGLPVVATSVGGNPEAITHGWNGYLAPPGDAAALAALIGRLLAQPELRRRMGERARREVERRFTLDGMIRATAAVFDEAARRTA